MQTTVCTALSCINASEVTHAARTSTGLSTPRHWRIAFTRATVEPLDLDDLPKFSTQARTPRRKRKKRGNPEILRILRFVRRAVSRSIANQTRRRQNCPARSRHRSRGGSSRPGSKAKDAKAAPTTTHQQPIPRVRDAPHEGEREARVPGANERRSDERRGPHAPAPPVKPGRRPNCDVTARPRPRRSARQRPGPVEELVGGGFDGAVEGVGGFAGGDPADEG